MHMPLAGTHIGDVTRQYVSRIGSIYERAKKLLAGEPKTSCTLKAWKWYRASAQACMEEAAVIYMEGLESLIRMPVRIERHKDGATAQFRCTLLPAEAASAPVRGEPQSAFRVGRRVLMDDAAERGAVERLLGSSERPLLRAFAEGLCKLQRLGAFKHTRSLTLNPDAAPQRSGPDGEETLASHL